MNEVRIRLPKEGVTVEVTVDNGVTSEKEMIKEIVEVVKRYVSIKGIPVIPQHYGE